MTSLNADILNYFMFLNVFFAVCSKGMLLLYKVISFVIAHMLVKLCRTDLIHFLVRCHITQIGQSIVLLVLFVLVVLLILNSSPSVDCKKSLLMVT